MCVSVCVCVCVSVCMCVKHNIFHLHEFTGSDSHRSCTPLRARIVGQYSQKNLEPKDLDALQTRRFARIPGQNLHFLGPQDKRLEVTTCSMRGDSTVHSVQSQGRRQLLCSQARQCVCHLGRLQALVYNILHLEEGAGKRCSEYVCHLGAAVEMALRAEDVVAGEILEWETLGDCQCSAECQILCVDADWWWRQRGCGGDW